MNKQVHHIVCATDDNYADYCSVMLFSLFENNNKSSFIVHILVEQLNEYYKKRIISSLKKFNQQIVFHEVDETKLEAVKFRKENPLTKAAYFRILLASVLHENIKKVLYLDCDILVLKPIDVLFDLNLTEYALAAVKDQEKMPKNEEHRFQLNMSYRQNYFNSGVMLINLEYWRKECAESKLLEFAQKTRTVYFHDQDALNYLFADKWFELPPQWNRFNQVVYDKNNFVTKDDKLRYLYDPAIIHYASNIKPWLNIKFVKYKKIYKQYYQKCFAVDLKEKKGKNTLNMYRILLEIDLLNFAYGTPLIVKIPLISFFNFVRILCAIVIGKKVSCISLYDYKV